MPCTVVGPEVVDAATPLPIGGRRRRRVRVTVSCTYELEVDADLEHTPEEVRDVAVAALAADADRDKRFATTHHPDVVEVVGARVVPSLRGVA